MKVCTLKMREKQEIKTVAIIGAGAAGVMTAAAFKAENYYDKISIFERRENAGGTWNYDPGTQPSKIINPGSLPPSLDPPLEVPNQLPRVTFPSQQPRFVETPVYESLTTNVPDIAMCFSDSRFAYGPFVPHHVPRQYIENYVSLHKLESHMSFNTTVEVVSLVARSSTKSRERWKLILRRYDCFQHADVWWEETFDAVILANGHYSVPFIPEVKGLKKYSELYPGRVMHSKYYRSPLSFKEQKVLVIGNSASGHDVAAELSSDASPSQVPVYQSRRSKSKWDTDKPPPSTVWKPVISEYLPDGKIVFEDGTYLDDIDKVIYCTGYKASFPFWNSKANGRSLWDYKENKLLYGYWHTFLQDFETLAIIGLPRVLTFRSFEYQAIALARLYSGRNAEPLPSLKEMQQWECDRLVSRKKEHKKFHDIDWDTGETKIWLQKLFDIAGLPTLDGDGRVPPVLGKEMVWAIEHLKKYPEPGKKKVLSEQGSREVGIVDSGTKDDISEWVVVCTT